MFKTLRIVFCVICALTVAASLFIFVYLGMLWGLVSVGAAVIFFLLMMFCKSKQEAEEQKNNPPAPKGDFITGKVPTDEKDKK